MPPTRITALVVLLLARAPAAAEEPKPSGKIRSVEAGGVFLGDCPLKGETRADDVVPGRPVPPINKDEKAACGVYYNKITYEDVAPPPWTFAAK